jgi:hypothetical protein
MFNQFVIFQIREQGIPGGAIGEWAVARWVGIATCGGACVNILNMICMNLNLERSLCCPGHHYPSPQHVLHNGPFRNGLALTQLSFVDAQASECCSHPATVQGVLCTQERCVFFDGI